VKEYIYAGDIFQAVLSQRFECEVNADPLSIYLLLKEINPSPYMYFLEFDKLKIIGSSPEILVKVDNGKVVVRPIAGTRPRGSNVVEDEQLAREMLNDPKERAEHVMLVDLGRNDIGKVSKFGSVCVDEFMAVEKYSHVQHIVSNVVGELQEGKDSFDALEASFPAGTVSGAPKVRAMQIIEELEPSRRGIYAGSVGYFCFDLNMDFAITIRTIIIQNGRAYIQAGAGIVADSVPEREYQETVNKGKAMLKAIELSPFASQKPSGKITRTE
ncbi:MAG: anthranilate synthase component I family protein, partial [Candidatus Hydrothermarchaeota archaeon]|nr:anthranilate synthase component I family protein [Candidatus Hydrothermarchaeota archaeon]